jgi:peptidoglycan/xylan/chitin deacetylase (PgdA/CDA1 family)
MNARNTVFKLLRYSGLPFLVRELFQRRRVSIVMFHDIEAGHAKHIFGWLARHYNIISLDDYLEARRRGTINKLPSKPLILTLDDGHVRNQTLLPVLQELRIPATIFLCAGIIDTKRRFWFLHQRGKPKRPSLKQMPNEHRLAYLAQQGFTQEQEFETPQALSKTDIETMRPWVNFQSHTVFHPCLPQCTDEEARAEISASKQILEQQFHLKIYAFAYPNGDYGDREVRLLREAGYECAITVDHGYNTLTTDPFRLKRLGIDDRDNEDAVCVKASGLWAWIKQFKQPAAGY